MIFIDEKRVYTYQYSRYFKLIKEYYEQFYANKEKVLLATWIVKVTRKSRLETLSSDIPEKRR